MNLIGLIAAGAAALAPASAAVASPACAVAPLSLLDEARSRPTPFASPAEPTAAPYLLRGLIWSPATGGEDTIAGNRDLVAATAAPVEAALAISGALQFYGIAPPDGAVENALAQKALCRRADAPPKAPPRQGVIVAAALPPIFYDGLAAALASRGVSVYVAEIGASDADLRLALNALVADHGWPRERISIVGHGAGAAAASLVAMQTNGVARLVSLDGFEALDARIHPGLSRNAAWKPGMLRVQTMHFRAAGRPHASSAHYDAAMRVDYTLVEVEELAASPWSASPEFAPAAPAIAALFGGDGAQIARATGQSVARFIETGSDGAAAFGRVTHRAALAAPAIAIDGAVDEALWKSAPVIAEGAGARLRVSEDCDYLYAAVDGTGGPAFAAEVLIDVAPLSGAAWAAEDVLLHASNSLCDQRGSPDFDRTSCGAGAAWWSANRTTRPQDSRIAEFAIAKSKIGVARCAAANGIAIAARLVRPQGVDMTPAAARREEPGTWSRR